LLDRAGVVHPRDGEVIRALLQRGVPVSIATGRMYSGTRDVARSLGIQGPLGCIDGSHIADAVTGATVARHLMPVGAATELLELLRGAGAAAFAFVDDAICHDANGVRFLPYVSIWSRNHLPLPSVCDPEWLGAGEGISAVLAIGSRDVIATAAQRALEDELQVATFTLGRADLVGCSGMIARARGATKATALADIARYHGVSPEQAVVVGDWYNDVPMLERAGRSFAMAQAPEDVKSKATDRLSASADTGGGIAEAAERAGLL
jgi:hypothetical protein